MSSFSFSVASDITVQFLLGLSLFTLGTVALYIFLRMVLKPQEINQQLLEKGEQRSFVAPLYYSLAAAHSYVLCYYMIRYSFEGIKYNNNNNQPIQNEQTIQESQAIQERLSRYFMDGIYISDAIFLPIFIILFTQMILFNEYGHMSKGLQFHNNIFTKRTLNTPPEVVLLLFVYSLLQLILIIIFNTKQSDAKLLAENIIDICINISQPIMQIVYEIYTNRRYQGCPMKSKKVENQIRKLRAVLIFFSIGRVFQIIVNIIMIFDQKSGFIITDGKQNGNIVVVYGLILGYALDQIVFQIIPFIVTFQKQIKKILLKSFQQSKLLQLDQEEKIQEIQLNDQQRLESSNSSDEIQNRYTLSDSTEKGIFELQITDFSIGEQFTQASVSQVQFGQLYKCQLNIPRYYGKPFICRMIESNKISAYMIEEINYDLQKYRKLNHHNIFPIKAMAMDSKYIYFLTPFFEHQSLGSILQSKDGLTNIDDQQIIKLLVGIADGIQFLHLNSISHGALKSNNIVLTKNNEPKIIDFGLHALKKFIALTTGYTTKSQYTAPELLVERSPTPDGTMSGDVYSFGMIIWEAFHKKSAFPGLTAQELIKLIAVEQKRPKIDETLPESIKDLIRVCWQTDPIKRPNIQKIISFLNEALQQKEL